MTNVKYFPYHCKAHKEKMLSQDLREKLQVPPQYRRNTGIAKEEASESPLLFPVESSTAPLESFVNRYAVRVHRGMAEPLLHHPRYRELVFFLRLKPLFRSSAIHPSNGKINWPRLAEYAGKSKKQTQRYIATLRRLKLVRIDRDNFIHLASYGLLRSLLDVKSVRKYKLKNNSNLNETLQVLAISDNLNRQRFRTIKKIAFAEICSPDPNTSKPKKAALLKLQVCGWNIVRRTTLKKMCKIVDRNFDFFQRKYSDIYDHAAEQIEISFPAINPNITLSCSAVARVCGYKSRSSGHAISVNLAAKKLARRECSYITINSSSPAVFENLVHGRRDIFSYRYPTRYGTKRMYFRRDTQTLQPLTTSIFF